MIAEWNKFKGWSVLEHFLLFPNSWFHINQLARILKISTSAAQKFCALYFKDGLLDKQEIGNVHQYRLRQNDARIRSLKLFIGPYLVADRAHLGPFLEKNKNILSIAVYGSFACGDYGDKSDLDIIIITSDERKPKTEDIGGIELRLGREANITPLSFAKWRQMERKKDHFFLSVKKNNAVVWGNPL